jgi:pimeloyl-ACP methyl ester carboxylesterase
MPTLRISDADAIAYDDAGEGPVIVLVHGSPGTSRAWQSVVERLVTRFRVIAPNLPGYGATTRPAGEGSGDSSYAAGLIEALIAEVGPPAVLAGHSYGGVVALMTALRGRVKSRALGLFEPVAVPVLAAVGETRRPSRPPGRCSRATARPSREATARRPGSWWTTGSARARSIRCPRRFGSS